MSSPLLLFKSGTNALPFFITHGLGGSVMELCELIGHVQTDHPIYGVQWRGLDGSEPPDSSVGDMAEFFIDAITRVQANGPYMLAGVSSGGLIMLEVATRLSRRGEEIAVLALLDTWPTLQYWPLGSWIEHLGNRVKHHTWKLAKMSPLRALSHVKKVFLGLIYQFRLRHGKGPEAKFYVQDSDPVKLQRLRVSAIQAIGQYEPGYYPGKITFLKADINTGFPSDPAKVWNKHCAKLEIHRFACEHEAMITTYSAEVAAQLGSLIESTGASSIVPRAGGQ